MRRSVNVVLCRVFIGFLTVFSVSAMASDFHSARTEALGGAGHAAPLLNDAIYLNPAFASFLPSYSFSADYGFYSGGAVNPDGSNFFHGDVSNVSIQDGRSQVFQAGVAGSQFEDAQELHIGASKAIIKQLGVGIGSKFIFPNDGNPVDRDLTFSLAGVISDMFQAVFVVDNLLDSNPGEHGMYREYIVGTKINVLGILMLYIDPHYVPDLPVSWGYESGAELTFFKDFFFRGGLFENSQIPYESARGNGYSFGAGWLGPRISIDYAYSHANGPIQANNNVFGLTLYF
jgi:hypothetical protein